MSGQPPYGGQQYASQPFYPQQRQPMQPMQQQYNPNYQQQYYASPPSGQLPMSMPMAQTRSPPQATSRPMQHMHAGPSSGYRNQQQWPQQQQQSRHRPPPSPIDSLADTSNIHFSDFPAGVRPARIGALPSQVAPSTMDRKYGNAATARLSPDDLLADDDDDKPSRFIFGCVPRNPLARAGCFVAILIVLVIAGFLVFLFIPRPPTVQVTNISPSRGASSFQLNTPTGGDINTVAVMADLNILLRVTNPGRISIKIDELNIKAFLVPNMASIREVGSVASFLGLGNRAAPDFPATVAPRLMGTGTKTAITLPAGKATNVTIPFKLVFSPDKSTGVLADPVFAELLQGCGITTAKRTMRVRYDATAVIGLLKTVGYVPMISEENLQIACPFDDATLNSVFKSIGSSLGGQWGNNPASAPSDGA
ncbi:hypothetical protein BC831DRAFT_458324 [Entophlyctis helioformis]|nr:hypothetical protein BC831DRAFT_458324 [Entophlyctis helioformis]